MKRIGIDCTDSQHEQVKRLALKRKTSIANIFREFIGWPAEQQGKRKKQIQNKSK